MSSIFCKLQNAVKANASKLTKVCSDLASLTKKVNSQTINIYRLAEGETGVRNREWHDTAPVVPIADSTTEAGRNFRLAHDFSLPVDTATTITNLNLNDTNDAPAELDIQVLDTVITVPSGGIWVHYTGGSEGYWAIEVGFCCNPLQLTHELGYVDRLDNNAEVGAVFLPEGQHNFRAWNIDSGGTNSSHQVSYSTNGTDFDNNLPDGVTLTLEKRPLICEQHPICDPIPDGWSECEPSACTAPVVDPKPVEATESFTLSDDTPIADNEVDTLIRTGLAGTSGDVSRADHNHPIRRQGNPGTPTPVLSGPATETLAQFRRFRSTEEWVRFSWRMRFTTTTANGWVIYAIPNIGGFQPPILSCHGNYEQTGSQDSEGIQTARMGGNGVDWADIGRLYYGQFSGKETAETWWPNIHATYIRN